MKLPEIETPQYTIELPISKSKLKFRPYLIKEQKILLIATESKDESSLAEALIQVLNNCLLDNTNLSKLPQVDVEYYFYQLRARSQSEIVTSKYKCQNIVDDVMCGSIMENRLNLLTDLEVINNNNKNIVEISDTIGIKFRAPYFELDELNKNVNELSTKDLFDEVIKSIELIYDENNTYTKDEMTKEQMSTFLDSIPAKKFEEIDNYFSNLPKIIKNIDITCKKCGFEHKIVMEDIFSFFI